VQVMPWFPWATAINCLQADDKKEYFQSSNKNWLGIAWDISISFSRLRTEYQKMSLLFSKLRQ
jgi:hypothetical protein